MMKNYSRVFLLTDRFRPQGTARGAVGYVIETYDNGDCEIEFSRPDGTTYAQITAHTAELTITVPPPALVSRDA